jgi:hypothetical protein
MTFNFADHSTPQRFARMVQHCRKRVVTPIELLVNFLQGIADHPQQVGTYFALLPQDLIGDVHFILELSEEEWLDRATRPGHLGLNADGGDESRRAHAHLLRETIREYLAKHRRQVEMSPALNWDSSKVVTTCPHCGQPLRTARAQQCLNCGADWHDRARVN